MDAELWMMTGLFGFLMLHWMLLLYAQSKITKLESNLRAIKQEVRTARWSSSNDAEHDALVAIGDCCGERD